MRVVRLALPLLLLGFFPAAAQPQAPQKWAVIVGVNDYLDNPAIPDLNFCVQDGELLAERLSEAPEGFPEGNIRLLTDEAKNPKLLPTRANIMAELPTWLSLAEEGDTVLVYFSGHGIEEEGTTYLVPSDARVANLSLLAVPLDFLQTALSNCKASQKFLILDACHSGGGRAAESVTDKTVTAIEEMAESIGMVTLASCDINQRAYEWEEKGHGAFTYFLAEALGGAADRDNNGELWASEVNDYVYRQTRKWAADQGLKQEPVKIDRSKGELVLAKVPPLEVGGAPAVSTTVETVEGLAPGTAKVVCEVEGARVLLDGVPVGGISAGTGEVRIPPAELANQHTIRVEMEGYSPWQSDPFTVPAGRSVQMSATLTKLEAILDITSDPPGATIKVNGIESGQTPLTGALSSATTTPQQYTVSLELAGYETWVSQPFLMKLGDRKAITAVLIEAAVGVPSPAPGMTTSVNPKDGAEMVYVPAGEFLMGSKEGEKGYSDERPQHTVYLDSYWIYKTEVTVAQFRKFCQATQRQMPPAPFWGWQDDHPIVNVSWDDAVAYAQWAGAALPTEAQWEKAARGTDGQIYPWGNEWDGSKCVNWVGTNNLGDTKPVGSYPEGASPYGALDMAGNVWEWCADWFDEDYYQSSPLRNPTGPATGAGRVLRGGSWRDYDPGNFRAAVRNRIAPTGGNFTWGFRCVLRSPGQD